MSTWFKDREKKIYKACETLLTVCSHCKEDEEILIVTDDESMDIGLALWDAAERFPKRSLITMNARTMHGEEPTDTVAGAMLKADVIFRATKQSLSHSRARANANAAGARCCNCCDYSIEMLEGPSGLYTDFEANRKYNDAIAKGFEGGDRVHITSKLGTDYTASIKGHKIFPQYGMSLEPGVTSSPPDIECATGAMPYTANGVVYVDGSITHPRLGLITGEPIRVEIKDSFVTSITGGEQAKILKEVLEEIGDRRIYQIGEIGVGLNPDAELCGRMLEDEGCMGTVHVALGNNETGNDLNLHIDMMFRNPTIEVDGKVILDEGTVVFD